ncbi:MAG: peptidase [Oscillospiraceae bacterium]|nr:peptidase [Oscillospiraceae bacterium]
MNVFISADIEGTCGITAWAESDPATPRDYVPFQRQMTREVKAACDGAIAAGADLVFVKDAHDSARNINPAELPDSARMMRGWTGDPLSMMSGLDAGDYGAVLFTGYHAWASSGGNPLSHTMNLRNEYVMLNGVRMSEFMMNAYTAGYYGVPVVFLSGDKALCDFAREFIPGITTVAVNEGRGGAVVSMHPDLAVKAIKDGAKKAVKNAKNCFVPMPERFEMTVRFREHQMAYSKSFYPGAALEDEKNVVFSSDDWFEMLRFSHFVISD